MTSSQNRQLGLLFITAFVNIVLSFLFGNQGFEAFITVNIALGLLITWQSYKFIQMVFQNNMWLVVKLVGALIVLFFWAITILAVIMPLADPVVDPAITIPSVNWLLVIAGVLPYVFSRIIFSSEKPGLNALATNMIVTIFSITTLFMAIVTFYGVDSTYRSLVLVLAVEAQFILNYLITKTNYIQWALELAGNLTNTKSTSTVNYAQLLLVGIPFFTPIFLIVLITTL